MSITTLVTGKSSMADYTDYKAIADIYKESLGDYSNKHMFSLGYQWQDKPHRHVYDLCNYLVEAQQTIDNLKKQLGIEDD